MGRECEFARLTSSLRGGEADQAQPWSALPRIAAARVSAAGPPERRLEGAYIEHAQRRRPASSAAAQSLNVRYRWAMRLTRAVLTANRDNAASTL